MMTIIQRIRAFIRNRRGNVAMMTGLCAVPLVGMVGLSIDYANAIVTKTKLDAAADAAAIAAITKAQAVILANAGATGTAFTDGQAQGAASFRSNAGTNAPTPTITVSRDTTQNTVSATVSYGATSANSFGKLFGVASTNLHATNSSTMSLKQYINIYLLVDISNSMGIAASTQDMNTMYAATGCVFGCHVANPVGSPSYETTGHAHGATLRIDVVKSAISNMINQTQALAGTPSTAQIGLYTMEMDAKIVSPPTTSFSTLQSLLSTQIDLGSNISPYTSADTSVQIAINTFTGYLPAQGDGSSAANAKNFVFVLTDGTSDIYNGAGGNTIATFDKNWFTPLKQKATVGIIYTTYLPFYNNNNPANGYNYWYSVDILPIASHLAGDLQQCTTYVPSSPNPYPWFISATSPSDINTALNSLLLQALANTRLTF